MVSDDDRCSKMIMNKLSLNENPHSSSSLTSLAFHTRRVPSLDPVYSFPSVIIWAGRE